MKSAEYYASLDRADAIQRKRDLTPRPSRPSRPSPFKVSKSTTAKVKGHIVFFKLYGEPVFLRVQKGYVTSAVTKAATIFRTRANARAGIDAYNARFTHACKMTSHAIMPVGDTESYHG